MYKYLKRIIDIIFTIVLTIILLPLLLIIFLTLLLNKINPIYTQERTGKNNYVFKIYKFRTMRNNITINRFCLFLRRTGLDELPQLFNILKGEMSFVGPRPWILEYSKYYNKKQKKRLNVLPGLTGYAQINLCNNINEKIQFDLYYVDNISFKFDLYIIYKTIIMFLYKEKKEYLENEIATEINDLKSLYEKN